MPEPVLDGPRIMASVRQGVPAAMAQHMSVHLELEASALANAFDEPINGIRVNGPPRSVARGL